MSLEATALRKTYGNRTVVRDVSLSVSAGEVVGLLGPNGAGKSTTVGMLYGSVIPDSGSAFVEGIDVQRNGRKARRIIGVVTQDDNPDPDFDVTGNLLCFLGYHGIYGAPARARADKLISLVGLEDHKSKVPDQLSGGLRRRLALARALVKEPKVLFLDEPTTGLDPDARQDFWRMIVEIKSLGTAIVLTTHYMEEAERLCDRVLLIQSGSIIRSGEPRALIREFVGDEMIECTGLETKAADDIAAKFNIRPRNYASGYIFPVSGESTDAVWTALAALKPGKLSRRKANLEDVFLSLAGISLDEEGQR